MKGGIFSPSYDRILDVNRQSPSCVDAESICKEFHDGVMLVFVLGMSAVGSRITSYSSCVVP